MQTTETCLEFILPGNPEPMLIMNNPPVIPNTHDLTVGPDGTVYRIVQRAFIIEKSEDKKLQIVGAPKKASTRVVIQCVIYPDAQLENLATDKE